MVAGLQALAVMMVVSMVSIGLVGDDKENVKEGETLSGTDRIWNQFSSGCPANTGKGSSEVDMSVPMPAVIFELKFCTAASFSLLLFLLGQYYLLIGQFS